MKSVLISIRPQWCEKIANAQKTIEVRKTRPKLETPFKCYIYCTASGITAAERDRNIFTDLRCKVIGEFVCDSIFPIKVFDNGSIQNYYFYGMEKSCLSFDEIANYIGYGKAGYGWHISKLKIYDTPKELDWFRKPYECHRGVDRESCIGCWECEIKRAPQSWCYVEGVRADDKL